MEALRLKLERFTRTKLFYALVFVISMLVMIQRRPYVLIHASFWAEDGTVFYPQMYHDGLISFLYPAAGYLHFVPRLVMMLTLPFGVINAPFISNLLSLVLRAIPMMFLFSRRFKFMGTAERFFMWVYSLVAPNIFEVIGNITNAQWNLAVYLLMVIVADPPESIAEKLHDWVVLILAGLSGPFVVFFAPVFVWKLIKRGGGGQKLMIAALLLRAVQFCVVLFTARELHSVSSAAPDKSLSDFALWAVRVFDGRVLWGMLLPFPKVFAWLLRRSVSLSVMVFLAAALPVLYYVVKGSWRFRVCFWFGGSVLMSSLFRLWRGLEDPSFVVGSGGDRYFVIPAYRFLRLTAYAQFFNGSLIIGFSIILYNIV